MSGKGAKKTITTTDKSGNVRTVTEKPAGGPVTVTGK
jgi:hypothetical protein